MHGLSFLVLAEELDDRLSRQLQRIQSQSDRVMEVVLTSLVTCLAMDSSQRHHFLSHY